MSNKFKALNIKYTFASRKQIIKKMIKVKTKLYYFLLLLIIASCNQNKSIKTKTTSIKGFIKNNYNSKELKIISDETDEEFLVSLDSLGRFNFNVDLKKPQYYYLGSNNIVIYLEPNKHVIIEYDAKTSNPETAVFKGDDTEKQVYLAQLIHKSDEISSYAFDSITPKFLYLLEKHNQLQYKKLNSSNFSKVFVENQKDRILIYDMMNRLYHKIENSSNQESDDIDKIQNFNKALDSIGIHHEGFSKYLIYRELVRQVLLEKVFSKEDYETPILEKYMSCLDTIKNSYVRDYFINMTFSNTLFPSSKLNLSKLVENLKQYITSPKLASLIQEKYNAIKHLESGSPSIGFNYENYKGGRTSLKDFRGKYVFIDFWATWCKPCIEEIPYIKKLEKKFKNKNISFVGISLDNKKQYNKWRLMVKKLELHNTQLFADNSFNSELAKFYNVDFIPHFVILDSEGNIVEARAGKPSGKNTEYLLDALLK